jgi:SNF2 family DNA or RNA helicase
MDFKIKPYEHQINAIKASRTLSNMALFWEMGTGKTGGMINILRLKYADNKRLMPTIIFSPLVTLNNWKREFAMHSKIPEHMIHVLKGTGKKKAEQLKKLVEDTPNLIIILNYEALRSEPLVKQIHKWSPEVMVCDESHLLKNHLSKRSKAIVRIADQTKHNYLLTGTPILNNEMDVFMQFRILDGGETFGKNISVFRDTWFVNLNLGKHWIKFPDYHFKTDKEMEFQNLIYGKSSRVLKKDCLDLPPLVTETHHVPLSKEQARLYKEMKTECVAFINEKERDGLSQAAVAQLALTKTLRLQQIASGFVKTEEGQLIDIDGDKCPRIQATKELLVQLHLDHKVILWCAFEYNIKQLGKLCDDLGIGHVFLHGGMNLTEKQRAMDAFERDDDVRVIIANRRAGGVGINLVQASYSIVYSRDFSLGDEKQSEARNHRGGSQIHEKITKINLCSPGTIDEHITQALTNKQDISDRIIDFMGE